MPSSPSTYDIGIRTPVGSRTVGPTMQSGIQPPVVLGFDPGTAVSGWAAVSGGHEPRLIEAGVLRARPGLPIEHRLHKIFTGAVEIIQRFQPAVVAIEDPFVGKNANGALTLGQARGVILLASAQCGCMVVNYAPRKIKMSVTGRGSADKEQVRQMVTRLLHLNEPPEPLDASDAIAVALCHMNQGVYTGKLKGPSVPAEAAAAKNGALVDLEDNADSARQRAGRMAARQEDAEALARWLSGGGRKK